MRKLFSQWKALDNDTRPMTTARVAARAWRRPWLSDRLDEALEERVELRRSLRLGADLVDVDGDAGQLYLMAVDGGEPRKLTDFPMGVTGPVWSPDLKNGVSASPGKISLGLFPLSIFVPFGSARTKAVA